MPPRLIHDYPDWDPDTGTTAAKPSRAAPSGSPRQGIPIREINPETDVNLGGGSRMIGRTPTYRKGGSVGGHTVHNYCAGGKVISKKEM